MISFPPLPRPSRPFVRPAAFPADNVMNITNCDGSPVDPKHHSLTIDDGFSEELYVCVPTSLDQYEITVGGGRSDVWNGEISWHIAEAATPEVAKYEGGCPYHMTLCPTPAPTVCNGNIFTVEMSDTYGDG